MSRGIYTDSPDIFLQEPERKRSGLEPHHIVQLVSAVLNALVVVYALSQKTNPLIIKILVLVAVLTFLGIVGAYTLRGIRWLLRKMRDRRIVADEQVKLEEMFKKFKEFTSDNHGGSFRNILKNASPYRFEVIDQIFESDYVPSWILSFEEQMKYAPTSVIAFFMRCREFSLMVKEFHNNYVVRAQKGIWKSASVLPGSCVDQLDAFREEYNSYLRDFGKWSAAVGVQARTIWGESPEYMMVLPYTSIDRLLKSFQKTLP
jgi:hypothetical protein